MNNKLQMELSKEETHGILAALRGKYFGLGNQGNTEAAELLGGVRERLDRARRRGEKLGLELSEVEAHWVLTAVREKREERSEKGKAKSAELLQGVFLRLVKARDTA